MLVADWQRFTAGGSPAQLCADLHAARRGATLEALAERWRRLPQPVIGRLGDGRLWLDLRCLEQEGALIEALSAS